jgi:hypothetical protein
VASGEKQSCLAAAFTPRVSVLICNARGEPRGSTLLSLECLESLAKPEESLHFRERNLWPERRFLWFFESHAFSGAHAGIRFVIALPNP